MYIGLDQEIKMKKIIILICLSTLAASCGSKGNKVNSDAPVTASGSEGLEIKTNPVMAFTGEYDILRKETPDCSNSIRIVSECNGVKVLSNGFNPAEEFCNINQGTLRSSPPNPDRNPPNPDNNGETKTVTLEGNVLKSELRLSPRIAFVNMLTMNENGVLVKDSNLKRGRSICLYKKR